MKRTNLRICRMVLSLFLGIFFTLSAFAQQTALRGHVKDVQGEPIIGANILAKGTTNGTITDADGNFNLLLADGQNVIVVSFIGYVPQEKNVKGLSEVTVTLQEESEQLDEVVVVGYGVQNKREVTGSIAKVAGKDLMGAPNSSFDATLQGRAAGVQVTQTSGMAGAGAAIRVRGVASITAGGDPLYVVDGMPLQGGGTDRPAGMNVNPMSSINPNDIESIEILKDASATAIYGSRGANGVVLITTKRGKKGKPVFNFNYRSSLSTIVKRMDMLNTDEYLTLLQEGYENDIIYGTGIYDGPHPKLAGGLSWDQAKNINTDWQDEVLQVGWSNYGDFSMQQGNDKIKTYFGLSASDEKSFLKEDDFKRISSRLNLDYNVTKNFTMGLNASYTYTNQTNVPMGWEKGGIGDAWSMALPYFPVHAINDDGTYSDDYFKFPSNLNPAVGIHNRQWKTRNSRVMGSMYLNYEILKGLSVRAEGNVDYLNSNRYFLATRIVETSPSANKNRSKNFNWNAKALANYDLKVADIHSFKFMIGTEFMKSTTDYTFHNVTFEPGKEDWLFNNPELPEVGASNNSGKNPSQVYSFVSFFGRINYALMNRYLLTLTYRRDGSSRFGANNKFGDFPAASIGWVLTEEEFLKHQKVVSLLKLKAGYGLTGNAEIPNYAQWGTTNMTSNQIYYIKDSNNQNPQNLHYWKIDGLANPDLKWETTRTFDVGLEYGFINNRISGEIGYYNKRSKDLFLEVTTPKSSGWGTILKNIGEIENKGFEFSIKSRNIVTRDFTWTTDFNIAKNINKVLDVGNAGADALGGAGDTRVIKGEPIGVNYLVKKLGVDPADGMPIYEKLDENKKVVGVTKEYNPDRDRQVVGHPYPDFVGGFNNDFTFKNWDLGILFTFQIGGNIYDDSGKFQRGNLGGWNLTKKVLDRWRQPGDITDVNRATLGNSGIATTANTTEDLYDASFLRLKSLSIGYTLPEAWVKKMRLSSVRLGLTGTNLFCITGYDGLDPEIFRDMENAQQKNLSANVTYLSLPQSRNFTFNLNVTF